MASSSSVSFVSTCVEVVAIFSIACASSIASVDSSESHDCSDPSRPTLRGLSSPLCCFNSKSIEFSLIESEAKDIESSFSEPCASFSCAFIKPPNVLSNGSNNPGFGGSMGSPGSRKPSIALNVNASGVSFFPKFGRSPAWLTSAPRDISSFTCCTP